MAAALRPSPRVGTTEWAKRNRYLSPKSSAMPGRWDVTVTPWVAGMHDALDDPAVVKVVARKSAQVAWTDGVLLNYIAKRICVDPCPMIVMFAKEQAAKEFNQEKFVPMVEVTPDLRSRVPVSNRKSADNRWSMKLFPGGFLKLVGSNSAASVKSTPAPVVAVEEPDDCNSNLDGQGDTITLLEERTKTFPRRKVIFGGTPTIEGLSRVDTAYRGSDQRIFKVPCPHCGEFQDLRWENVRWQTDPSVSHEVFGHALPETAVYVCPHCGGTWTDSEKNAAVRKGHWEAQADFHGVAGFYINEIYSSFAGSKLRFLVEKYLAADKALSEGDDSKMRSFVNNQLGLAYAFRSDLPSVEELEARAEDYEELHVPAGGLLLTAGVDVQHDRLAVVVRAWGRAEESWLVYWGEIHGQTAVAEQGAWKDLDAFLSQEFPHALGARLRIRSVSIDSSDGQTSDAVYSFVRKRMNRGLMAIKGSSTERAEIFNSPQTSIDKNRHNKAWKYGVTPFIVGVDRAKDLMLGVDASAGRIRLTGNGPARMHWYKGVRPDYWGQMLSEVKAPHRSIRGRKVWQKKSGERNEALDCEVYALHAARALKINLWSEKRWASLERELQQMSIFDLIPAQPVAKPASEVQLEAPAEEPALAAPAEPPKSAKPKKKRRNYGSYSPW